MSDNASSEAASSETATAVSYLAGSLKWDAASKSVAIRTEFPEVGALADHAWLVATKGSGALSKTSADVEAWTDIEGYPIPEPEQPAEPEPAPTTPA